MNTPPTYLAIAIAALAVIAILVFSVNRNKQPKQLTPLAGLAFGFVLAGLFFGDDRFTGYILLGVGIVLAVIDIIRKAKNK